VQNYLIAMMDKIDSKYHVVMCKDKDEMAYLLLHLDEEKYIVSSITVTDDIKTEFKEFCVKEINLEKGDAK
jgi:hypothetical protein